MNKGLELRLIEKGFDPSTRRKLSPKQAKSLVTAKLDGEERDKLLFFEGTGSTVHVSTNSGVDVHFEESPIFFDNSDNGRLKIYSMEQLLRNQRPASVGKLSPVDAKSFSNGTRHEIHINMGVHPAGHHSCVSMYFENGSVGYTKAFPRGAPKGEDLFRLLVKYLGLNPQDLKNPEWHKYSINTPDRKVLGNTVNLTFGNRIGSHGELYVIGTLYGSSPRNANMLKSELGGLNAAYTRVKQPNQDWQQIPDISKLNGSIIQAEVHFNVGRIDEVYNYLRRVLAKPAR